MFYFALFSIFFIGDIEASEQIIRAKVIHHNTIRFHLSQEFAKQYTRHCLTLTYPQDIDLQQLPPSIVDIPLITQVIPVIWLSGKAYEIEEMDEDLYYSLIKIKEFFKRFFYNTSWNGALKPQRLIKNSIPAIANTSAALWTGGVDSTATVLSHLDEHPTLISFNDPHQHAVAFAHTYHLNISTIYMNHHDFLKLTKLDKATIDISKWFWDTTMGLAWIGAAAPFLYAKGIPILYIPSGFTWDSFIFPHGQTLEQPACPLIDENVNPAGLCVHHDGFTLTRTEKIKFISTFCAKKNITKPQLVVCNYHTVCDTSYTHCNRCFKCYITMLDILAIGQDIQEYGFTMDQEEFIAHFKKYLTKLTMRPGGTYVALRDTQRYLQQHKEQLPEKYRSFYDWFLSVDLWAKVTVTSKRPFRPQPFSWDDYQDLYNKQTYPT